MATTVTKVIDPDMGSGYDYDSLYDWEAAQQGDLTGARNEIAVAKCRCTAGTADTTAFTMDGWTTSATQYIKTWTDTSETYRHNGTYQTGNKYRIEISNTNAIMASEEFVKIIGIQIKCTKSSSSDVRGICFWFTGDGISYAESCIVVGTGGDPYSSTDMGGISIYQPPTNSKIFVINCIVYGFTSPTSISYGFGVSPYYVNATTYIYNCTLLDNTCGFYSISSLSYLKNVLLKGNITRDIYHVSTLAAHVSYCSKSDSYSEFTDDGNNRNSQTFSFVGAADFHLQASDTGALGYGLNLYNDADYPFQTDIDGQDRGGAAASWDIGADEYVSSAIEQEGFRFRNDDGSESAATWKANQDVNINLAADTAFRLRFLLKATGNPDSIDAQAEARVKPSGGAFGAWEKIN